MNHIEFDYDADFEWHAVDSMGYIAMFATGGSSCYPDSLKYNNWDDNNSIDYFSKAPPITKSIDCIQDHGVLDSWRDASERGLWGYDVDLENGVGYLLICKPEKPIHYSKLLHPKSLPFYDGVWGSRIISKECIRHLKYKELA